MNYNPIYLCFCKANNLDPATKRQNNRFVWWVQKQKAIYAQKHGIVGNNWTNKQIDKFHSWLKNRYLGGVDNAPGS